MTTPNDVRTVEGQVFDGNLRAALQTLGRVAGYDFGRDHWRALANGLKGTDSVADRWYECDFDGQHRIRLRCAAHPRKAVVLVRAEVPAGLEPQVRLLLEIVSRYRLRSKRQRRFAPPELGRYNAGYVCGEPLDLLPEDDRVPHTDNPPPEAGPAN